MPSNPEHHCRICGLEQTSPPWGEDGRSPTYEICDCCGGEFGYEDFTREGILRYRSTWRAKGAPWFAPEKRPTDWNLALQLQAVPPEYRDPAV